MVHSDTLGLVVGKYLVILASHFFYSEVSMNFLIKPFLSETYEGHL